MASRSPEERLFVSMFELNGRNKENFFVLTAAWRVRPHSEPTIVGYAFSKQSIALGSLRVLGHFGDGVHKFKRSTTL